MTIARPASRTEREKRPVAQSPQFPDAVEGQRVEEDPRRPKPMKSVVTITPVTPSTINHQVRRAIPSPKPRTGKPTPREHPVGEPHDRKAGPADERAKAMGSHHGVPEVVTDARLGHGLAPRSMTPSGPAAARISVEATM